jgi:hypothetical protein
MRSFVPALTVLVLRHQLLQQHLDLVELSGCVMGMVNGARAQ